MAPTDDAPSKATLYCPACDHAGHLARDWRCREDGDGRRIVCPECETTVTRRPASERADDAVAAWVRACRAWLVVWTPWMGEDGRVTG